MGQETGENRAKCRPKGAADSMRCRLLARSIHEVSSRGRRGTDWRGGIVGRSRQLSRLQKPTVRSFKIQVHCSAHLQMGVLTGIVANIADHEIGATKVDPRLLQAADLMITAGWFGRVLQGMRPHSPARWARSTCQVGSGFRPDVVSDGSHLAIISASLCNSMGFVM